MLTELSLATLRPGREFAARQEFGVLAVDGGQVGLGQGADQTGAFEGAQGGVVSRRRAVL
jgi:hypothetical protein